MYSGIPKRFITFVGDPLKSHPSFQQAIEAGLIASWVHDARELITDLARTPFTNLIIFDTKYQSAQQCAVCQQLKSRGYRIVCVGAAGEDCEPYSIPETDLLSAILSVAQGISLSRAAD